MIQTLLTQSAVDRSEAHLLEYCYSTWVDINIMKYSEDSSNKLTMCNIVALWELENLLQCNEIKIKMYCLIFTF